MLLKNIESYIENDALETNEKDLMSDIKYITSSLSLITEFLQKGYDVIQLANGDIVTTELKLMTFRYSWDPKIGKLFRAKHDNRPRNTKPRKTKQLIATS